MDIKKFYTEVGRAVSEFTQARPGRIVLVYHDDADGLCSGAIVKTAFERKGREVEPLCLEKAYPEVIENLHSGANQVIIYSDIGSAHADFISECNSGRNLTMILDHHDPTPSTDPKVYDLNLEHHGFRGETDFSGATCNYLFARSLSERNIDLSYLALVGSREIPGDFIGPNKVVLDEAEKNGVVQVQGKRIKIAKLHLSVDWLFSRLQILGAVGYYGGGPQLGIQAATEGPTEHIRRKIGEWEKQRKAANKRLLAQLYRERLKETEHIQWFDAGDNYEGMGTKVIGQFCSYLSYQERLVKSDKYILGFMNVPQEIPNWGKLKELLAKVSVRVSKRLKANIDKGGKPGAANLLSEAAKGFGIADGHDYAANVIIPINRKDTLINNLEKAAYS